MIRFIAVALFSFVNVGYAVNPANDINTMHRPDWSMPGTEGPGEVRPEIEKPQWTNGERCEVGCDVGAVVVGAGAGTIGGGTVGGAVGVIVSATCKKMACNDGD